MKTAHIISHSHWDREWYMPYESHHMRLIMLIDQILNAIDNDANFKSFHLDGQTICIDDYLQVKPENRDKLMEAIQSGKIHIGPWYILQDAFLTSSEANVRNGLYGHLDCKRYGAKTKVGYYPDTFGIYSQAPQILKNLEIDNMIFGRGITTTGFNNTVSNEFESKMSEMYVRASNGDQVLGILFANWYSNGNEIPNEKGTAKEFWDSKLKQVTQYTDSEHLLFMNGCDHTPYQEDVTKAIDLANQLYPDINFVHSSFEEYLEAVKTETVDSNKELTTVGGELVSQATAGYYSLVNTASSRIYQKIANSRIQQTYEQLVEPLSVFYSDNYPHDEIEYGWKKLMQNHPHDSICGCSVDSVHRSIDMRFEDSENVAKHIIDRNLKYLRENINYQEDKVAFAIINPMTLSNTFHCIELEAKRFMFGTNFQKARDNAFDYQLPKYKLVDTEGEEYECKITDLGPKFGYYLPDDVFRRAYYSRNIEVEFNANIDNFSHKTFILEEVKNVLEIDNNITCKVINQMENENLIVTVNKDSGIEIENKTQEQARGITIKFIDEGDIGNEYMFGRVKNDKYIFLNKFESIELNAIGAHQELKVKSSIDIPTAAETTLRKEQLKLVAFHNRESKRSKELVTIPLDITLKLNPGDSGLEVNVEFTNVCEDHRLRAVIETAVTSDNHNVDSAFEIVKRSNKSLETWENPNFDRRMFKFVELYDEKESVIIATNGLHEYEILENGVVAITLLRATGELGDWGHFPTPEAQTKMQINAQFKVYTTNPVKSNIVCSKARNLWLNMPYTQIYRNEQGSINLNKTNLQVNYDDGCYVSAFKNNSNNEKIIRFTSNGTEANIDINCKTARTNFLEEATIENNVKCVLENEIVTLKLLDDKEVN